MTQIAATENLPPLYDVVILWTNGSDPLMHQEEGHLRGPTGNRAREWGELETSVKLLRHNARHLGTLFIVTPKGVRPSWLAAMPQVYLNNLTFVDQDDILPAKYAKTSSSNTIQWYLHRIRRLHPLTDPFLMMNDDWLVTKPLDVASFVQSNTWYVDAFGKNWGTDPFRGIADDGNRQFRGSIGTANRVLQERFPEHVPSNVIGHVPAVVRNSTLRFIHDHFDLEATLTQKRENHNVQFEYMLASTERQILPGVRFLPATQVSRFLMMDGPLMRLSRQLEAAVRHPRIFMCINDNISERYLASEADVRRFKTLVATFMTRLRFQSVENKIAAGR